MKTFLKVDYWVETVLLILLVLTIPTIFIPMVVLAFFGAWQVSSAFITFFCFPKLKRKHYLPKALGYLLLLYMGDLVIEGSYSGIDAMGFVLFWLIIPLTIGNWYYGMVCKDYHHYCKKTIIASNTMEANSPMEKENRLVV